MCSIAQSGQERPRNLSTSTKHRKTHMKTDTQVKQDVSDELGWDQSVRALEIGVAVNDGIVTLSGQVASYSEKWHAEAAAQRVSGVKALAVEIKVILPGTSQRTDADIARAVENILLWSTFVPNDHIKVMVESGWLTLSGEVDWEFQKQAAVNSVSHLMGVTGISDQIGLRPAVSSRSIKSEIEAALARHTRENAHKVQVDVDHTSVTLSGTVDNWSDRELARRTAWGTPGVHKVQNNISIAW